MSGPGLRRGTHFVISTACQWWWIMCCMKATSAFVCSIDSAAAASSADSFRVGSPGAPGCTTLAVGSSGGGLSEPPQPASRTAATGIAAHRSPELPSRIGQR